MHLVPSISGFDYTMPLTNQSPSVLWAPDSSAYRFSTWMFQKHLKFNMSQMELSRLHIKL
jgi:hypothetical protein